jgi:hypothetical protein
MTRALALQSYLGPQPIPLSERAPRPRTVRPFELTLVVQRDFRDPVRAKLLTALELADTRLMEFRPPMALYSYTLAIVSGVLLAESRYLAGTICAVGALALATARYIVDRRREDDKFTIW